MVGMCGVLGGGDVPAAMVEELAWTGDERRYAFEDDDVDVRSLIHDAALSSEPATAAGGDVRLWLDGAVYGYESGDGYRPREEGIDSATFCARLYEEHGSGFVSGLNGGFTGVLYDRAERTVSLFTDRLATRELFYTRPEAGSLVFSSRLQGIPLHPAVSTRFDREHLLEYVACRRSFGVTTPLSGVRLVPPGSVLTVDLGASDLAVDTARYWRPRHRPVDEPFSWFVDEFVDRLRQSVAERTPAGGTCGVLLSGGSDSRLVLAALGECDVDVIAYHLSDWMGPEARRAEHVALAADVEFRYLRRPPDYYDGLLEHTPKLSNFSQRFTQAFADGFTDRIREEVDYLVTGHFADTWFRGHHLPTRPGVTSVGRRPREITTTDEYVDSLAHEVPGFVDATTADLREVLAENLVVRDDSVVHHGVEFDSLRDLGIYGRLLPKGTDPFFRQSLRESLPFRPPLLDNRLLDLATTMPLDYQQRRDVVDSAISRFAPELATVPSANTGVPLTCPYPVKRASGFLLGYLRGLVRRARLPGVGPPLPEYGYGSWGEYHVLLRRRTFPAETLSRREAVLDRVPLLDRDGAWECYRDHLAGADWTRPLYALLTFLEMPVVDRVDLDDAADTHDAPGTVDVTDATDVPGTTGVTPADRPDRTDEAGGQ